MRIHTYKGRTPFILGCSFLYLGLAAPLMVTAPAAAMHPAAAVAVGCMYLGWAIAAIGPHPSRPPSSLPRNSQRLGGHTCVHAHTCTLEGVDMHVHVGKCTHARAHTRTRIPTPGNPHLLGTQQVLCAIWRRIPGYDPIQRLFNKLDARFEFELCICRCKF